MRESKQNAGAECTGDNQKASHRGAVHFNVFIG